MNKTIKKYIAVSFGIGLTIWFATSLYLSLISVIGLFVNTDPYIANRILAASFLLVGIIGTYNYIKRGDINSLKDDIPTINLGNKKSKSKCRTCKNGNV